MGMCFVPDCKHYSERDRCKFFRFPKEQITQRKWIKLIRREDSAPSKFARVCSCHFENGNKNNLPTIFKTNETKLMMFESPTKRSHKRNEEENSASKMIASTENEKIQLTVEQRLQLEEQMRMFVQLLTQSYLLSFGIPALTRINESSKKMLEELKVIASQEIAAFQVHNLDGALTIIDRFLDKRGEIHIRRTNLSSTRYQAIPHKDCKRAIVNSNVFMYPDLLPKCGFSLLPGEKKLFTQAEDNLIALGLERFSSSTDCIGDIQATLVPCKTARQIKIRIKNSKTKGTLDNPIKYYLTHKQVPTFPRIIKEFNSDDVKAPKDQPRDVLPNWAKQFSRPDPPLITPYPSMRDYKIVKEVDQEISLIQKYRMLVPRGGVVSSSEIKKHRRFLHKVHQRAQKLHSKTQKVVLQPQEQCPNNQQFKLYIVPGPPNDLQPSSQFLNYGSAQNGVLVTPVQLVDASPAQMCLPNNCEMHLKEVSSPNLPVVLPNYVINCNQAINVNPLIANGCLNSNETSDKIEDNFISNANLIKSTTDNVVATCDVDSNDCDDKLKSETNPQDVSKTIHIVNNDVNISELDRGLNLNECDITVKSEVIDDSEEHPQEQYTSTYMINISVKRSSDNVCDIFTESNAFQEAHYKNFKRRKIEIVRNNDISGTSEFIGNSKTTQCNFPTSQKNIDDFENFTSASCLTDDKSSRTSECVFPIKQEIIDDSEDPVSVSCLTYDKSIGTSECPIKQEKIDDDENSTSALCLTDNKSSRTLECVFPIKQEIIDDSEDPMTCLTDDKSIGTSECRIKQEDIDDSEIFTKASCLTGDKSIGTSECVFAIKHENVDDSETSTDVSCLIDDKSITTSAFVSNFDRTDCNIPLKVKAIDKNSKSTPNISNSSVIKNYDIIRTTGAVIKSNALQVAQYKRPKVRKKS